MCSERLTATHSFPAPPTPPVSDLPLAYRHRAGDGDAAVLVLHGLGADETDLLPLTEDLPDAAHVVSLRAPDEYSPGYSWFGFDGPDPTSAAPVASDLRRSRELLEDCRAAAVEAWDLDPDSVGLFGFSQGAMLAVTALAEAPETYPWAVASHGYLPDAADPADEVDVAAFVSVGEADRVVPPERGREAATRLRELGCAVTERSYPVGHGVAPDEAADAAAWVRER